MRAAKTVLIASVLAVAPALAQDWKGMGRMEGKVLDSEGKPIAGAAVELLLPERGGGTTVTTDKKGKWAVGGIAAGAWTITATADGYVGAEATVQLASEATRLRPLEFKLRKAEAAGPPPEVMAAFQAAEAASQAGRHAEARAEYEKLLALRPDLARQVHASIALTYSQEQQFGKALEHLQKVLEADPGNTAVRGLAIEASIRAGEKDRAAELARGLDVASVKDPSFFYNIAVAYLNAEQPAEALVFLTHSVTADPAFADGYYQRALTHLQLGDVEKARPDFQKVIELDPEGPSAATARKALEDLAKASN